MHFISRDAVCPGLMMQLVKCDRTYSQMTWIGRKEKAFGNCQGTDLRRVRDRAGYRVAVNLKEKREARASWSRNSEQQKSDWFFLPGLGEINKTRKVRNCINELLKTRSASPLSIGRVFVRPSSDRARWVPMAPVRLNILRTLRIPILLNCHLMTNLLVQAIM